MKRSAWWSLPIAGLGVAMLCLSGPTTFAATTVPTASTVKSTAPTKKTAAKPAKPKTGEHKTAAAKQSKTAHRLAAHDAKSKPAAHKVAALTKKSAAPVKTAAAKPASAKLAAALPAPPPSTVPGYTVTTVRDGVAVATTLVVVPVPPSGAAAKPAPRPVAAAPPSETPTASIVTPVAAPATAVAATPDATAPMLAPIKSSTATGFVTTFLDSAFGIARTGNVSPLQRRAQLGQLFAANMDIADMAGYTTGEKLAGLPVAVQQRFRSILISYLVETYYPKIEAASDRSVSVAVTAAPPLANGTAVVWTTFTKEGWGSQSVQWHLAATGGSFKVTDTLSGGASLIEMERATFLSVMRNGGVPDLMARLDARTRELASAAPN
jgi:ABC-type transporter MlaC component